VIVPEFEVSLTTTVKADTPTKAANFARQLFHNNGGEVSVSVDGVALDMELLAKLDHVAAAIKLLKSKARASDTVSKTVERALKEVQDEIVRLTTPTKFSPIGDSPLMRTVVEKPIPMLLATFQNGVYRLYDNGISDTIQKHIVEDGGRLCKVTVSVEAAEMVPRGGD